SLFGWISTFAWSISFYPQLIINWRRKSVEGLSIDFFSLNPLGFACYTVYNVALYASPTVRRQYSERHDGHYPQAQPNDIAFAVHALVFSLITLASIFVYKRDPKQRLSTFNRGVLAFLLSTIGIGALLVATDKVAALDLVLWLSYVKLYISTTKMVPQAWINFRRKSTVGWSIENILLDFTGGVLSLAQLVLDSWVDGDLHGIIGNPGKLGLGLLALGFDLLFMLQHFVLYRDARLDDDRDRGVGAGAQPPSSSDSVEEDEGPEGSGENEALLGSSRRLRPSTDV
ncbi:PQ loop repeat-domain-containing protein, partial [Rhodotorula diobovata]